MNNISPSLSFSMFEEINWTSSFLWFTLMKMLVISWENVQAFIVRQLYDGPCFKDCE